MTVKVEDKGKVPVLPVSGLFSELSAGSEVTSEMIAKSLLTSDENLALKTQHNLPIPLTQLELLAYDAKSFGFLKLAGVYTTILRAFRENMCSKGGWRSNQIKEILIADLERSAREGEDLKERLVGGRGSR